MTTRKREHTDEDQQQLITNMCRLQMEDGSSIGKWRDQIQTWQEELTSINLLENAMTLLERGCWIKDTKNNDDASSMKFTVDLVLSRMRETQQELYARYAHLERCFLLDLFLSMSVPERQIIEKTFTQALLLHQERQRQLRRDR